jgi:hypothetical protein
MPSEPMNPTTHTTGEPMTDSTDDATPTFHATTHGARMPIDATHSPAATTGDPMTEIRTHHDTPTPSRGPMPPDTPPDDEPIPETLRMITPDDAVRAELNGVACMLGVDELRVLVRIGERLKLGRRQYGRLYLPTDTRSFRTTEAREELEDALVYLACAWLKAELQEGTR